MVGRPVSAAILNSLMTSGRPSNTSLVISLLQPNPGEDFATQTLPRKLVRAERSKTNALGKAVVVGGPSTIIASNASISHVSAVDVDMRKTQSFITRRGQSFSLERFRRPKTGSAKWQQEGDHQITEELL
ncbi:unnamed protein product [Nippostrongylus brasiliensis]|uniref:Uncharacterized protein n=1 Tax=Nippostrongylus brasiliensis TaxID=27835 RepID=A0A0N4XJI5_NIPBR|nr:unnamed protein product [Nippostrongylus brasiliensis]